MTKLDYQPRQQSSPSRPFYLVPGLLAVLALGAAPFLPSPQALGVTVVGVILLGVALYMKAKAGRPSQGN